MKICLNHFCTTQYLVTNRDVEKQQEKSQDMLKKFSIWNKNGAKLRVAITRVSWSIWLEWWNAKRSHPLAKIKNLWIYLGHHFWWYMHTLSAGLQEKYLCHSVSTFALLRLGIISVALSCYQIHAIPPTQVVFTITISSSLLPQLCHLLFPFGSLISQIRSCLTKGQKSCGPITLNEHLSRNCSN